MSGKKSRDKGQRYERKIAKIFSEWAGMDMLRTPLSGGWARGRADVTGDIVPGDANRQFPFSIECKKNESWTWEQVHHQIGPVLNSWWQQTVDECAPGKIPLLIFSRNRYDDYVLFSSDHMPWHVFLAALRYPLFIWNDPYAIMRLSDFLVAVQLDDEGALQACHQWSTPSSRMSVSPDSSKST